MNKFIYSFPAKVYFGQESVKRAFDEELPKAGKTVMLAYGGGSVEANGIYDEMVSLLKRREKRRWSFPASCLIRPMQKCRKALLLQESGKLILS